MNQHAEICPFCRKEIAQGATVCNGCGAEKELRMPWWRALLIGVVLTASALLADLGPLEPIAIAVGIFFLLIFGFTWVRRGYTKKWVRRTIQ